MNVFHRLIALTLLGSLSTVSFTRAQDNIVLKNGTEISAKVLEVSPGQIKYRRQDNPDGPIYSTGTTDILLIRYANGTKDILGAGALSAGSATPVASPIPGVTSTTSLTKLTYHHGLFGRYFSNAIGERVNRSLVQTAFGSYPDVMQAYQRGQSLRRWSYVTGGSAVALLGAGAIVALSGDVGGRNDHRFGLNDNATTNDPSGNTGGRRGDHGSAEVGLALAGGGVLLGVTSLYLGHRATLQFRRAADRYTTHQATSLRFGPSNRGLGIGASLVF